MLCILDSIQHATRPAEASCTSTSFDLIRGSHLRERPRRARIPFHPAPSCIQHSPPYTKTAPSNSCSCWGGRSPRRRCGSRPSRSRTRRSTVAGLALLRSSSPVGAWLGTEPFESRHWEFGPARMGEFTSVVLGKSEGAECEGREDEPASRANGNGGTEDWQKGGNNAGMRQLESELKLVRRAGGVLERHTEQT